MPAIGDIVVAIVRAMCEGFKLAIVLLFLGIVMSAVVGKLLEGEFSPVEGIVLILLPLTSLTLAITHWRNILMVILSCGLCFGVVVLWALHRISEERIRRHLLKQEIERYKATIRRDPKNAAAHSMLGDVYLKMKRYDEAIKEFEEALKLDPMSQSDRYKLKLATEKKREAELKGVTCPRCHEINSRIRARCQQCDYELNRPIFIDFVAWLIDPQSLKRVVITGAIAIFPLTLTLFVVSLLPSVFRAAFWLCVLAGFVIWLRRSIL
ncbi:MAG: tetratricopeptide repeat protein [Armatimonadota bacterium]|nr:tetratricopeptide repeat protein [Armatimonadota bacterium]MCX7776810.1 tetratricopeptide repeat protein [Armatimonadota bacterium]MDW8024606.1 tetratricopeptide repeat protein [Armatimonadota bacterium]